MTKTGAALVFLVVVIAIAGPFLVGDPTLSDLEHGLSTLGGPLPPSGDWWLGTDPLGRDVLARLVNGAGTSLAIAAASTGISLAIGTVIGLTAGYAGGRTDSILMRLVDLTLAFPVLLLAILLAAVLRESHASAPAIVTLGLVGWTTTARVIRGKALAIARSEHVIAARALGATPWRIVTRHVLPNVAGMLLVVTVLGFAQNLLAESVLSYLGLGPPPPAPTWGRMLYEGRAYYRTAPHLIVAPGVAIVLAVVAFQLVADGLRARRSA